MPRLYTRSCDECSVTYTKEAKARFCSRKCYFVWLKSHSKYAFRYRRVCNHCNVYYEGQGRMFCSSACSNDYRRTHWSGSVLRQKICFEPRLQEVALRKYKNILTRCKGTSLIRPRRFVFMEWYNSTQKICIYCHIPQEILEKLASLSYEKFLQVDRMDSSIGYQSDNLVLACFRCNRVKNQDLTYEEMLYVGEHFMRPKWQSRIAERPQSSANAEV